MLGAAFGYYYYQSSGTVSSLNQTVTSQSSQIGVQAAQIASDTTKIANLTSTISTLQSQVAADQAKITSLTAKDAQANQTIASLNSQISTLNGQIASYQSQVSSLQAQVSTLQDIVNLKDTVSVVSGVTVTETASDLMPTITTYDAPYSGVLVLTGTMDAPNGFFLVDQTVNGVEYSGHFEYGPVVSSSGTYGTYVSGSFTLVIPVSAGSLTLHFASADATYDSATVSVSFIY